VGVLRARLAGMMWLAYVDPERRHAELGALVEEARPAIEQDGDPAALAALEYAAGYVDYLPCRNVAAFAEFTRAMQHARQAGDLWFETSIRAKAAAAIYLGPTPRSDALRWIDDAAAQSVTYQPELGWRKAAMLAELERFDEARSLLAETIDQMNERGLALPAAWAMQTAWEIETLAGDDAAAERNARQGCEQLDRIGERAVLSTLAGELAEALYALGRYEEAGQWARRGLELGSSDDLATQMFCLGVQAKLLARKGKASAAIALAERVDRIARTSQDPRNPGDTALYLAEIMYLTGNPTRAEEMTQRAIDLYQSKGATAFAARARRLAAQWASRTSRRSDE
jgi:tetratricopeptide (TPR) repeat protein